MRPAPLGALLTAAALLVARMGQTPLRAQEAHGAGGARAGAQALLLVTRAAPAFGGRSYTEAYVTQPALMAHLPLLGGRAALTGTLNLEPLTLRRGELNAGIFGEGYVDRRHPHTLLHELIASAGVGWGGARGSLAAGKGFVPFGTDDPMVRPFAKYPVNHHYAQLLERAVAVGALSWRTRVALEAAAFNGDEPEGVYDQPNLRRFGDSWAARLTIHPLPAWAALEAQGSVARVASPENALGGGLDQRKTSVAARYAGARVVALAEWARTDEYSRRLHAFRYESVLAEASGRWRGAELGLRAERTTRPEEQRMADAFRSPRPHDDFSILGLTRWQVLTARLALAPGGSGGPRAEPFAELSRSRATSLTSPSLFVPRDFYGASTLWSLSAGVRLRAGAAHSRMGRYGAASLDAPGGHHHAVSPKCRHA
ncbi:MAG TPA: hypothetical protein VKA84_16345 [Gemmatimonadaceae bacterium]|nr:hypothetical protein [Gemmatimonadaceae bacterium]